MRNFRWSHTMHDAARRGSAWLAICALFLASGCGRSNHSPGGKEFTVRGIVRGLSPDRTTVDIQHEAIPGYMPSMTMPFAVREPRDAADLRLGDTISFRLVVNDKEAVINHVTKIPQREIQLPSIGSEAPAGGSTGVRLREGDALPEFSLTSETSEKITRDTFQGKPLLLTFIFTRCPVATFCPRMSKNFSELQEAIKNTSGASAGTRLLSITIDPGFDTPAILAQYAQQEMADPNIWRFATGEPRDIDDLTKAFAVYRENEGGTISHGLTTALITPDGKIAKLWRGNGWSPQDVLNAINGADSR